MTSDKVERKGIEQGRAKYAYKCAEEASKLGENSPKEYKSHVKKLPMMIKTNGLGATLAFIKTKSDKAYETLYRHLFAWVKEDPNRVITWKENEDFTKQVISLNSDEYRLVTIEIMSFLNWLRRFADGLIEGEADNV